MSSAGMLCLISSTIFSLIPLPDNCLPTRIAHLLARFLHDRGPLRVFLADAQQPDARIIDPADGLRVSRAHEGILLKMPWLRRDVRADIADHDWPMEGRENDGNAGTNDARQQPHPKLRRGDARAGIARADHNIRLAL